MTKPVSAVKRKTKKKNDKNFLENSIVYNVQHLRFYESFGVQNGETYLLKIWCKTYGRSKMIFQYLVDLSSVSVHLFDIHSDEYTDSRVYIHVVFTKLNQTHFVVLESDRCKILLLLLYVVTFISFSLFSNTAHFTESNSVDITDNVFREILLNFVNNPQILLWQIPFRNRPNVRWSRPSVQLMILHSLPNILAMAKVVSVLPVPVGPVV